MQLKAMTPNQLEAEWRRVFPGKKAPLNKHKVREALMLRQSPKMTPDEFIAARRAEEAAKGERCHHKTPVAVACEACRVEAEAVKAYMRLNKITDENKARSDLGLKVLPAAPAPVASIPSKPLAPVTPENDPAKPVAAADDLVGVVPSFEQEIKQHKAQKRR